MPRFVTNVALSIKGERVEKGTEIELTAEEAAHLDPNDIAPFDGVMVEEEAAPAEVPTEELSHAELKERAKALGLSASGSKADLQERIALHEAAPAEVPTEEEIISE